MVYISLNIVLSPEEAYQPVVKIQSSKLRYRKVDNWNKIRQKKRYEPPCQVGARFIVTVIYRYYQIKKDLTDGTKSTSVLQLYLALYDRAGRTFGLVDFISTFLTAIEEQLTKQLRLHSLEV